MRYVYLFIGLMLFASYMFINRAYASMYNKDGLDVRGSDDYIRSIDQIVKRAERAEREEAERAAKEAAETDNGEIIDNSDNAKADNEGDAEKTEDRQ